MLYLHALHVIQDVLLVLIGGDTRQLLRKSLLPQFSDISGSLPLGDCPCKDTLIVIMVLHEVRVAVSVDRKGVPLPLVRLTVHFGGW